MRHTLNVVLQHFKIFVRLNFNMKCKMKKLDDLICLIQLIP